MLRIVDVSQSIQTFLTVEAYTIVAVVYAVVTDGILSAYAIEQDSNLKLRLLTPYEAEAVGRIGVAIRFEDKDFLEEGKPGTHTESRAINITSSNTSFPI